MRVFWIVLNEMDMLETMVFELSALKFPQCGAYRRSNSQAYPAMAPISSS